VRRSVRDKAIHALWDDLARFPAAEIDTACRHLMATLASWLNADNAAWIGMARLMSGKRASKDPLRGWRSQSMMFLRPPDVSEALLVKRILADRREEFGLCAIATARLAGSFRVHRLRDGFVDLAAFQKTLHYRVFYRELGVNDRLWIGNPLTPDAESFFVFDKRNTRSRFTATHAAMAGDTLRGLLWFQRQLMFSHGLSLVESPLTPMERRVVQLLLSEKSEKEIAAALKQSAHTTHSHIKQIYRKYGTQGRAGLMGIWLSRR
jgi:DNA-binding CsgD family transcriptional regulator